MTWFVVGDAAAIAKARKVVVEVGGVEPIVVLAHGGQFYAFRDRCIHKGRELSKGVVLNGKLVCPGHQWAFQLGTGWEAVKEQCQPTFAVREVDGVVEVEVTPAACEPGNEPVGSSAEN